MQKNRFSFRSAFSMLELIFVIVILGIVSSIGAEIIAKMYGNYIVQRALHRTSVKTELVATQIANRLAYAIPNTVIARLNSSTFESIDNAPVKTYNILQWIAYDADSFGAITSAAAGNRNPGWSGFCDVNDTVNTTTNTISTPGSDLSLANTIITNLSGTNAKSLTDAGIVFPRTYNVHRVGFKETASDNAGVSKVATSSATTGTTITLDSVTAGTRKVKEHYKLAWTAYAIVPTELTTAQYATRRLSSTHKIYDLVLHYNFQPWDNSYYDAAATKKTTLLRNVSVFNFMGTGDTIRFKLCTQENIGETDSITMCKEKAVIR